MRAGKRRQLSPSLAGVGLVLATAAIAVAARGAEAAPSQFTLTLNASHVRDSSLPAGLSHEGPFTASAPFCPAGKAADVKQVSDEFPLGLVVLRKFMCDDGTGSITALLAVTAEHAANGRGRWQIVDGSGQYAKLRGMGTYASTRLSGDPADFLSITFRSTWSGTVDFDVDPPSIGVNARATKLRRPAGSYTVRVVLSVPNEAPGATLSCSVDVTAGKASLGSRVATTRSPTTTLALRIKPSRTTRRVKVSVEVTDPVGNRSNTTRTIALPR